MAAVVIIRSVSIMNFCFLVYIPFFVYYITSHAFHVYHFGLFIDLCKRQIFAIFFLRFLFRLLDAPISRTMRKHLSFFYGDLVNFCNILQVWTGFLKINFSVDSNSASLVPNSCATFRCKSFQMKTICTHHGILSLNKIDAAKLGLYFSKHLLTFFQNFVPAVE